MTYKDIINRIRTVVDAHLQLQDFGYGQLSDLKTQFQLSPQDQGVDYPYLFLLPQSHQRQGPVMNYSFNMIVMDMARGEEGDVYDNYITIQSQCQEYIDDVIANLYYYYKDQPDIELTGITYTPFKEKYQDELAGMTATITIQVPTPLNDCITPIVQPVLMVEATNVVKYQIDPEGPNKNFIWSNDLYDPELMWNSQRYESLIPGSYKFVIAQQIKLLQPGAGQVIPTEPVLRQEIDNVNVQFLAPTVSSGWPTQFESTTKLYQWRAEFEVDIPISAATTIWEWISLFDNAADESGLEMQYFGNIKIYRLDQ